MKRVQLLLVAILLIGFVATPNLVSAQVFTSYITGTQVMNLGAADASVILTYYRADDGSASAGTQADQVSDSIPLNTSKTYFPAVSPFNGSVVISSSEPLGAIVNVQNSTANAMGSYVGASAGATTVSLPLLMKNNGSVPYFTWFSIQNTGSVDANVTIDYTDCAGTADVTAMIKPSASKSFYQASEACHTSKVFAASITSSQPVVVVAMEENAKKILAYTGFKPSDASPDIVMPLINTNNGGIQTGVQIQNTSATETEVTVSYTPSLSGAACTETQTIPGNSSKTFALNAFSPSRPLPAGIVSNCAAGERFIGSAKVTTNSAGVNLVGIVNQSKLDYAGAYGTFNPANATPKVVMPLLMDRNGSNLYFTGFSVMNVGGATTWVKCTMTGAAAASYTPSGELAPGGALTPNMNGQIAEKYVGSGQCTAYTNNTFTTIDTTAKLVAIVNELGNSVGADRFLVYEGINVQP